MKYFHRYAYLAAIVACFGVSSPAQSLTVEQLSPVYVDPDSGFVYFLVKNNGYRTINNLFGTVYGYGSLVRSGTWRVNNQHSQGIKVSLGDHRPGSTALYRFMVTPDNMDFSNFMLKINENSLFFPLRSKR